MKKFTVYVALHMQGKPAGWPSPHCSPDLNYDFGQQKVRDHFVANVALPMAAAPNVKGLWFDDTDWLSCKDMCNEVHGMSIPPRLGQVATKFHNHGAVLLVDNMCVPPYNYRKTLEMLLTNNETNVIYIYIYIYTYISTDDEMTLLLMMMMMGW